MKRVYVAGIRPDDQISDHFRVVEARLAPYRDDSQGHYLIVSLADRSGQIEGRLWDEAEETARWLAPGQIVHVRARAGLYRKHLRLRLLQLAPAEPDAVDLAELIPLPEVDAGEALALMHGAIEGLANPALRNLLQALFADGQFVQAFCLAPSSAPGQLLAHTLQLLELAAPLAREEGVDFDLLTAAILLHRAGETTGLDGPAGARAATLLGTPALSDQLVGEWLAQMPDFPAELALQLRHAILAAPDPASARTREATILAHLVALQAALWRDW